MKHRGYLSQRKNETQSKDKELGRLLAGVNGNREALQNRSDEYRTAAELAVKNLPLKTTVRCAIKAAIIRIRLTAKICSASCICCLSGSGRWTIRLRRLKWKRRLTSC